MRSERVLGNVGYNDKDIKMREAHGLIDAGR